MKEQPVCHIDGFGYRVWQLESKKPRYIHREDGPAVITPAGCKMWWVNNKRHRLDGPAVEFTAFDEEEWWINNKFLGGKEISKWIRENNVDLQTEEGQMALILRWT